MQHLKANYLEAPSELSRPRNCLSYLVPKHLLNANCPGNSRYRFLPSPWQTAVCFLFLVIRPLVMGSLSVWSDHHSLPDIFHLRFICGAAGITTS